MGFVEGLYVSICDNSAHTVWTLWVQLGDNLGSTNLAPGSNSSTPAPQSWAVSLRRSVHGESGPSSVTKFLPVAMHGAPPYRVSIKGQLRIMGQN